MINGRIFLKYFLILIAFFCFFCIFLFNNDIKFEIIYAILFFTYMKMGLDYDLKKGGE